VKDRETINDELHGASLSPLHREREDHWPEERYEFYLNQFQIQLDTKIHLRDKQSYQKGLDGGSVYITKPEFRLRFLRAERYDAEKAAIRYCKCLDFLVEFFGRDALFRPLLMSDLTRNEMKFFREGYIQVLPSRDRLGRRILAQLGNYGGSSYSELEKFRVCVYVCFSVLAEDFTSQCLGVVSLGTFTLGAENFMRQELGTISRRIKLFFSVVPLRWTGVHLCIPDDPVYHVMRSLVLFFLGTNGRRLLRIHVGTPIECDYKLRSFGIPTDDIPRTHTHSIKIKKHARFLKVRKLMDAVVKEAMQTNQMNCALQQPGIECPEINCVLFGRYAWDYPGNIEFRGLLREMGYSQTEQEREMLDEMNSMVEKVIKEARSRNFRFMVYDRDTFLYTEVKEHEEIRGLVEQSVREHRKRSRAKRMIDETNLAMENKVDGETSNDAGSNIGANSFLGQRKDDGAKYMKDCGGCRCSVGQWK